MQNEPVFLLHLIVSNNYRAYIVGGFVRDFILGSKNNDVDIVTDAPVNVLLQLFFNYSPVVLKNGTIKLRFESYNIDVVQMRKEIFIDGKISIFPTKYLLNDYLRRDFTFNAIYMDENGSLYTMGSGIDDCINKRLKFIGNPKTKCIEDPTRIIRGIYFILKYNISDYDDMLSIKLCKKDFIKCDINQLNRMLFKILKLEKNAYFVKLLEQFSLYDILFKKRNGVQFIKPIDFLLNNEYIFINSIFNI